MQGISQLFPRLSGGLHNLLQSQGLAQVSLHRQLPSHEGVGWLQLPVEHLQEVIGVDGDRHFRLLERLPSADASLPVLEVHHVALVVGDLQEK